MDIDIDFANREHILSKLKYHTAILTDGKKHNTGVYVTQIPNDPRTNLATIEYKQAEKRGYFKIDFLNVSLYNEIKDEQHLYDLMNRSPMWNLLEHDIFVDKLFHLSGHGDICKQLKPTSIQQLAAVLAIIRPAKRHLQKEDWETIIEQVWEKPKDGAYYFKKAHAVSYAVAVVVHMNLLCEKFSTS